MLFSGAPPLRQKRCGRSTWKPWVLKTRLSAFAAHRIHWLYEAFAHEGRVRIETDGSGYNPNRTYDSASSFVAVVLFWAWELSKKTSLQDQKPPHTRKSATTKRASLCDG